MNNFRVGIGFDVHSFSKDFRPLIMGGVLIPNFQGLLAYSDGDVLIHAVIDSLLGASGLGDIGLLFSNKDPKNKNINSRILLNLTSKKIQKKKYSIKNIDITIIAERPKFIKYIKYMRLNLSKDLNLNKKNINIKSTTTEKLGFIGRKEGIACQSIVLIYKKYNIFKTLKKFFYFLK